MLSYDFTNLTQARLGKTHGLNLESLLTDNKTRLQEAIEWLFAQSQEAGGWKRWVDLDEQPQLVAELQQYAASKQGHVDDLVILGIGGSSLGGLALLKALLHPYWNQLPAEKRNGLPRFHFVDNVDADCVEALFETLTPERTLINVISKSGTTAESMAAFLYAKAWLEKNLPSVNVLQQNMVFTTDKAKGVLRTIANEHNVTCFEVPDDVGGRFSVFCAVGLLPAALCGIDIAAMLQGVSDLKAVLRDTPVEQNPVATSAVAQVAYMEAGKPISVFMPYSTRLAYVADWYVQLWAESLGKASNKNGERVNVGPTPLKAVGATDQHSQIQLYNEGPFDKVITFIQVQESDRNPLIANSMPGIDALEYLADQPFHRLLTAEFEATRASLTTNQRPNLTVTLPKLDAYHFGQLLYFFEVQTALAGYLMNIDPFDQPGVELAKEYTYALMGRKGFEHLIQTAKGEVAAAAC